MIAIEGSPEPLGVTLRDGGANVAVVSRHAGAIWLCLFDDADRETGRLRLEGRTGDVHHAFVPGLAAGQRYGLRADGPFEPSAGHRFDVGKLLVDPYATRLDRPFAYARALGEPGDTAALVPKAVIEPQPAPQTIARPGVPWPDTIVYELSVKGFTAMNRAVPERDRGTFAGLAHPAAVEHLVRLGVTTVELMPAMTWVDERHLPPLGLSNAWGYNPVALMAPDPRLAPGGWDEVRRAVAALQSAGLEVILDVVLNHTGEGDELGPTLSLRGLDNALYYRLRPDDRARYIDDAGCGNVLALDRPPVMRLALDALRTWAARAGLDGFRFDLATTLGRRDGGFDPAAPFLAAVMQDPVLRDLKLVAEPWDIGPGGYQTGAFGTWGEWNDRYRDDVRRFWRGDGGMLGALATRLAGSQDLFAAKGRPSRSVNFVTAHDGFTLADLVAYGAKRNHANGEDNRDGTDANHSWTNGVEGQSDDPAVVARRQADQRALLATLLLSRGTPMLAMGAEAGRTQLGNNNAYAQDNALGWLDWDGLDGDLLAFTARLADVRRQHPALRADRFLTGADAPGSEGFPDVAWLNLDGRPMDAGDWSDGSRRSLAVALAAPAGDGVDRALIVIHGGSAPASVTLPWSRPDHGWRRVVDSGSSAEPAPPLLDGGDGCAVAPRSVQLHVEEHGASLARRRQGVSSATLSRLARAAGIAPDWWEETGRHHAVSDATRSALLTAMGLSCSSEAEARESLEALAEARDRRPVPQAAAVTAGLPSTLRVAGAVTGLVIAASDATRHRVPVDPATGDPMVAAVDGRMSSVTTVGLPPLPAGRFSIWADGHEDAPGHLLVSPGRCVLPPPGLARFGVAAHLYAVRGSSDQGIGDFTTLAELGVAAAERGASTVGLNPLHALFPGDRERASPYHPSDRRFLDPIYLDVEMLGAADPTGAARALVERRAASLSALRDVPAVDYPAVWRLKSAALEAAWIGFRTQAGSVAEEAFERFRASGGPDLEAFARFQALAERQGGAWWTWPDDRDAPADRIAYHAWLQWLADGQLAAAAAKARQAGLGLGFYRDLAVGAAPDGAEIWADQTGFARGVSIGAPPDRFSADGQVWNLPPPNPISQVATGAAAFGRLVCANMRHAGALRIDHVMALTRLFWVPEGGRGADGAYVGAPLDLLLAELALQSHAAGAVVVGEDLGTVPDGLRERLDETGVLSYRVLWFERDGESFRPPETWPATSAACVSTHDLPTLAGWWIGRDIEEKRGLGLMDEAAAGEAFQAREREKRLLHEALDHAGLWPAQATVAAPLTPELCAAIHAFVARSPSALVLAQLDDLAGEVEAVNLPGTDRERPNWRRRSDRTASAILKAKLAVLVAGSLETSSQ